MKMNLIIGSIVSVAILLGVSFTSVVGVSDVEDDCGCQVVRSRNLVKFERLLARLEVYINIILLKFGHMSEIQEKCREILDLINSDSQDYPIICSIINEIMNNLGSILRYLVSILEKYPDRLIIHLIISPIGSTVTCLLFAFIGLYYVFHCDYLQ